MLLKAALCADVISRGRVSLQLRLTSQTRLRRWISQGTAEMQETTGAGSFQPASLQWTGLSRQLLLRQGWLQSTNCVMQYRMTIMIQLPGVKNDCKQLGCLLLPDPNKGLCELYCQCHVMVGRYIVCCTCKPNFLMCHFRLATLVKAKLQNNKWTIYSNCVHECCNHN